ncbi:cytochrome P450 81Q32 [Ricinus communis]|uniref:Cytochrome P450, putative n=1 Tax=Ricinus communis TaxID=3988 RepID=B9SBV3_RICCO|nr:cytochrome P450 81Q32 [Ricinus communis]EEF38931.1 cytochrome P450, putative [Ricinus communis]|eukprot:XP_002523472.1 cytochrome P450 81E8 [Ricinus communis]
MINSSMEDTLLLLTLLLPFLLLAYKFWPQTRTQQHSLPPSPPALPIIGHLHLIKIPLHRSLQSLSNKYGPIISLRLGSRRLIIISSPSAVEECFTKNDITLANRPALTVYKYMSYNCTTLATSSYGDHWRNLRRISAVEVFSSNRLNMFVGIRRDEIEIFLNKLYRLSRDGFAKVELKPILMELSLNTIMRMVAGKRYYGEDVTAKDEGEAKIFREMITEIFEYAGASYLGDYLPILKWIDPRGFLKKVASLHVRTDVLLQGLIDEHRGGYKGNIEGRNTMISHLLSLQESEPENYSDQVIKGLLLDIIFAGTESTAVTLEWAMSSLLNNPQVLEKAKDELDIQIGQDNLMDESDLSKLPYLQNIISETLRLYPAGPLLLPHLSSQECSVGGYLVEPNTMLLVNAWAIHRDPELWDDAVKFKPERFENFVGQGGINNQVYKLMPFGLGRRSCPGMGLANRVLGFALGSMIHCFEWKRVSEQEIDMSEGFGLTMPKAEPLQAMCKARDAMKMVMFSSL